MNYKTYIIILALAIGSILATVHVTVMNIALPTMIHHLQLTKLEATWVINSYNLTFSSFLLLGIWISNNVGPKKTYLFGLFIFIISSLFCSLSQTGVFLIMFRLIQGIGSAIFIPSALTLLSNNFKDDIVRAKVIGIWGGIVSLFTALGIILGGEIVHFFNWQSIFYINIPISLLGMILTYFFVTDTNINHQKFNISHILIIIVISLFSILLINLVDIKNKVNIISDTSMYILLLISILLLIVSEFLNNNAKRIIPLELLLQKNYILFNLIGFFINLALFGKVYFVSLYVQNSFGYNASETGLMILPMMVAFCVANLVFSIIIKKYNIYYVLLFATISNVLFIMPLLFLKPNIFVLVTLLTCSHISIGLIVPAFTTICMSSNKEYSNITSSLINFFRQVGALVGISLISIIMYNVGMFNNVILTILLSYVIVMLISFKICIQRDHI